MSEPIKLSPALLTRLRTLNAAKQETARRFTDAAEGALLALELDPNLNHQLNLDTGVLTPAKPDKQEGA